MKADDVIRLAYKNEESKLELSDEAFDEMLNYIENCEEVTKKRSKFNLLKKIGDFISKLPIRDYVGVAAFILVLIFVPYGIDHYNLSKNQSDNSYSNKGVFVDKLEKFIEDTHSHGHDTSGKIDEVTYTDINEIKEKAPFYIEYPNFLPEGYALDKTGLRVRSIKYENGKVDEDKSVEVSYKNKKGKSFDIIQRKDSYLPVSIEWKEDFEKISLNGLEAWVNDKETSGARYSQIIFCTRDRMYNVIGFDGMDRNTLIKIAESFNDVSDPSCWPTEKYESYSGMNEIKEKVPFDIEFPKFYPKGYDISNSILNITRSSLGVFYEVDIYYDYAQVAQNNFSIKIINEASKPKEVLKKCKKSTLGNLEVWIYPSENSDDNNQVIFWKNGLCYDIYSSKLDIDTLKKIAESYND